MMASMSGGCRSGNLAYGGLAQWYTTVAPSHARFGRLPHVGGGDLHPSGHVGPAASIHHPHGLSSPREAAGNGQAQGPYPEDDVGTALLVHPFLLVRLTMS